MLKSEEAAEALQARIRNVKPSMNGNVVSPRPGKSKRELVTASMLPLSMQA